MSLTNKLNFVPNCYAGHIAIKVNEVGTLSRLMKTLCLAGLIGFDAHADVTNSLPAKRLQPARPLRAEPKPPVPEPDISPNYDGQKMPIISAPEDVAAL